MAKLAEVWFWPNGGRPDGLWGDRGGLGTDAFARTSRRVTERYSEGLSPFAVEAKRASLQMMVFEGKVDSREVVVELAWLNRPGEEIARAVVPAGVAELTGQDRARLVLDVVDAAMRRIGHERNWPIDALEGALAHTVEHHLDFSMFGAWKATPSRKTRVRPVARIGDSGWSELRFEVADAKTRKSLGYTPPATSPLNSLAKFKRSVRSMRLHDDAVERPDEWQPRMGSGWLDGISFDLNDLHPWPETPQPVSPSSPLPIEVRVM